jgi:YVTN family beta-propeller protein
MNTPAFRNGRRRRPAAILSLLLAPLAVVTLVGISPQTADATTGSYVTQASIPVGGVPSSIAVDAYTGIAYVANSADGTVSVVAEDTNTVTATISVGGDLAGIAVDEKTGLVFVSDFDGALVDVIDGSTNTVLGAVRVGLGAEGVAVNESAGLVFVANSNTNTVSVISEATGEVAHTIPVGVYPTDVAVDETTGTAYVSNSGPSTISVISPATWKVAKTIDVGGIPGSLAVDEDTGILYVGMHINGQGPDDLLVIDPDSDTVTTTLVVPGEPGGTAVDDSTGIVVDGSNVISEATNSVVANLPVTFAGPVAIDPYSNVIFAGNPSIPGSVTAIAEPISITSAVPEESLTINVPYSLTFTARGASPVTFSATYGSVPAGLTLNSLTGVLSGIPTALASSIYGITATDSDGDTVVQYYEQVVQPVVARVSGADRYATAIAVSQKEFPGTAPVVYVASGENYPDALSAGPVAVAGGGPLLLTDPNSLPSSVAAEIGRLQPNNIVVIGGSGAVSASVIGSLNALLPKGRQVTRFAGADRYATSQALALGSFSSASTVYIATGANFPDALTAGGAAASKGDPLLLVNGSESSVDPGTASVLTALKPSKLVIVGGTSVVSASLASALGAYGRVSRLSGADRYATAAAVNADAYSHASQALVATGTNFPDALSASVWAGRMGAPLYLSPGSCLPRTELSALDSLNTSPVTLVGGSGVLTQNMQTLPAC